MLKTKQATSAGRIGGALICAAILFGGAAWAKPEGRCATAYVPETMVMPNGSVQPAGSLKVCLDRAHSPVAGQHTTSVDGRQVGIFISARGVSEAATAGARPIFVFTRNAQGQLEFEGYLWPDDDTTHTFAIAKAQGPRVVSQWWVSETKNEKPVILLAAN